MHAIKPTSLAGEAHPHHHIPPVYFRLYSASMSSTPNNAPSPPAVVPSVSPLGEPLPNADDVASPLTATSASVAIPSTPSLARDEHGFDLSNVNALTIRGDSSGSVAMFVNVQTVAPQDEGNGLAVDVDGVPSFAAAASDACTDGRPAALVAPDEHGDSFSVPVDDAIVPCVEAQGADAVTPHETLSEHASGYETSSNRSSDVPRVSSIGVQTQVLVMKHGTSRLYAKFSLLFAHHPSWVCRWVRSAMLSLSDLTSR